MYRRNQEQICDAPKPGGPLTTRQPAEYKWMSGYPTPLQKIGQSLLCKGSSTQLHHLHKPVPNSSIYAIYIQYMSNTATWAHKQYSICISTMNPTIYPIVTRVTILSLLTIHILNLKSSNTCKTTKATFWLSSRTQPLGRAIPSHAPCTCRIKGGVPRWGELKLSRRIALSGLLTT